jgi:mono/diheme cytochrome c family protein
MCHPTENHSMNRTHLSSLTALFALLAWIAPATAFAGDAAAGKEKFTMFCVTCHGETGKGDGPGGAGLQPPPRDFSTGDFKFDADGNGTPGEDSDLNLVITKGAAEFGGSPLMTPWGGAITEDDIDNLVAVIRSLKE